MNAHHNACLALAVKVAGEVYLLPDYRHLRFEDIATELYNIFTDVNFPLPHHLPPPPPPPRTPTRSDFPKFNKVEDRRYTTTVYYDDALYHVYAEFFVADGSVYSRLQVEDRREEIIEPRNPSCIKYTEAGITRAVIQGHVTLPSDDDAVLELLGDAYVLIRRIVARVNGEGPVYTRCEVYS